MRKLPIALALYFSLGFCLGLALPPEARAGVVFDVETKDHRQAPAAAGTTRLAVEGDLLKMNVSVVGGARGEIIFRGDRKELLILDHDRKSYFALDEAALQALSEKVEATLRQIDAALAKLPPGKRALVEQAMKRNIPGNDPGAPPQLRKSEGQEEKAGYSATRYEVLQGGYRIRELWVADWDTIPDGEEAAEGFAAMAGFLDQAVNAFTTSAGAPRAFSTAFERSFMSYSNEIEGFPVATAGYGETGRLEVESSLRSAESGRLDPAEFEPPAGYERRPLPLGP